MFMVLNSPVHMLQRKLHTWSHGFGSLWLMICKDYIAAATVLAFAHGTVTDVI